MFLIYATFSFDWLFIPKCKGTVLNSSSIDFITKRGLFAYLGVYTRVDECAAHAGGSPQMTEVALDALELTLPVAVRLLL